MKLYHLLIESRIDFLRDKYLPIFMQFYKNKFSEGFIKDIIIDPVFDIDPTNNKIYAQWIFNNLKDQTDVFLKQFLREDAYKWKEYLTIYHKVKNKLPLEQRDINKLNLNDLKDIALQYKEKEDEVGTKNEVLDKKYKINENNEYLVYMFKTSSEQDFQFYQLVSTNTEWCTRPNYKTFGEYVEQGPLFIFINKNNRENKYQFHEQSSQFMDKNDNEIDNKLIIYFIKLIDKYLPEDFAMKIIIDNSYGFIDKKGNILAKGFNWVGSFFEGFAVVIFQDNSYGFIDKKGNILAKGFRDVYSFSEGFAEVQFQDYSWGYIDKKGNIIAKGFKYAWSFSEGFARVKFQDYSWGYIDKKRNIYESNQKTLINKNDPRLKGIEIYPDKFI